jgi:hypothetical protein
MDTITAGPNTALKTMIRARVPEAVFENNIERALSDDSWTRIKGSIQQLTASERNYVPTHKKGGTIAYATLRREAPEVAALYHSPEFMAVVSGIVGCTVRPTPLYDQNSCSVLMYERPGDHIGWHYDHNFYRGRHFTVLIPIVNIGRQVGERSSAELLARIDGSDRSLPTPPNSLIVFEGAKVLHKVTPIADGERRIILSMTYCEDPTNTRLQDAARRIKDISFFGVRALWS